MGSVPADLTRSARRLVAPVLYPTVTAMRRIALAGVWANAGLIMTGAAVRLSASGPGLPGLADLHHEQPGRRAHQR